MEMIRIDPLTLSASRICLGTWAIGGWMWGGANDAESISTILAAFDLGINVLDTAPVYGFGRAEEVVGKALTQYGHRDKIIIATKAGLDWKSGKIFRNSKSDEIRGEIEKSLIRLKTDYIDIYQIHWPDPLVPLEETASTLLSLFNEGKIRGIGVSNFSPEEMKTFMEIAPIHTSQPPYNLFERDIELNIFPFTESRNIISLCYGALCRGLLSGRMRLNTQFREGDLRKNDPKFQPPRFEQYLKAVEELNHFAMKNYGKDVMALAMRWVLDRGKTIALRGARNKEQLNTIHEVMGWHINQESMSEIDEILARNIKDPVGPEFLAPPVRAT